MSHNQITVGEPVVAEPSKLDPEFVDHVGLKRIFSIGRSSAYELVNLGEIRSVCLRKAGNVRGRRLFHVGSVRQYILRHEGKKSIAPVKRQKRAAAGISDSSPSPLQQSLAPLHVITEHPPLNAAAFRARIQRMQPPNNFAFAIRHRASGVLVGYADITNVVRGAFLSAYLSYYAFQGHQRQALMTEGLGLVVRYAFGKLGLHRLEANIQPENIASIALVKACGFSKEGYSPRYLKIAGRWRDHERWALLAR